MCWLGESPMELRRGVLGRDWLKLEFGRVERRRGEVWKAM
jgi:hypothetical protein